MTKQYTVVFFPGTEDEFEQTGDDLSFAEAKLMADNSRKHHVPADIMKRLPDGTLTTEF